jgi:hypothetical protein
MACADHGVNSRNWAAGATGRRNDNEVRDDDAIVVAMSNTVAPSLAI